ncbi:MAG: glycoside hydrolase domain-containing protein [Thermoproteota archaeon]
MFKIEVSKEVVMMAENKPVGRIGVNWTRGKFNRLICLLSFFLVIVLLISWFFIWFMGMMKEERFVAWGSSPLEKILKDSKPPPDYKASVHIEAVRNEYACAQFAVTVESGTPRVRLNPVQLEGPGGFRINFSVNFVGFVPVRRNTPQTPSEELIRLAPFDAPDPLLEDREVSLKEGETQPVWITIFVPPSAPAGDYAGRVDIISEGAGASISVLLKVYPVTLRESRSLWLTNWFSPTNVARFHNVKTWSEEHWSLIRKYARIMAEHRQNVIITPIFELIRLVKLTNGSLSLDFSSFDRWVELFMEEGVIGRFEGGHLAGRSVWEAPDFDSPAVTIYYENGSVAQTLPSMKATSTEYRSFLSWFLPLFQEHLEEKGWVDRYIQHLADEPIHANAESYKKLAGCVKTYAPKLRRIDAIQCTELVGAVDIWVPILHEFDANQDFYVQRREAGEETWFYTCLAPTGEYPNRFIDYPLMKVRVLHWINFEYNLSGYLHWGLNYWSENPFTNVEPNNLPPGDAFIIYPGKEGPLSSIRFEALRLGVQDYELLRMLEERDPAKAKGLAEAVVRSITDYEKDPLKFDEVRRELMLSLGERE